MISPAPINAAPIIQSHYEAGLVGLMQWFPHPQQV